MRNSDFEESTTGILVPTVYDQKAFVPHPLPPENLNYSKIAFQLADTRGAIGELKGACKLLPNPYILIQPLQRLEAQTSSAMEGTHTTTDALVMVEAGVQKTPSSNDIEVFNYSRSLSWALQQLENLPVSVRMMKGAHRILLEQVGKTRGQNKQPGEFARDQNMIGARPLEDRKERLASARFIPPPPQETIVSMSDLERYINRNEKRVSQTLIDIALVHYQFETIHPFADGNGRVGRMLITLMAVSEGLLDMPILYMSPEFEKKKDAYIDHMYQVSSKGTWEEYINFFLKIAEESCTRSIQTIHRVLDLQKAYHDRARNASRSNNINTVIDMLFFRPVVQPKDIVAKTNITDAAARNLLRSLTKIGILQELPNIYPTIWVANELLDISRPT